MSPEERANKLNRELAFASSKLKAGSSKIANSLDPMLMKLSGKITIKANDENDYFKVDSSYNGDINTLMGHVTFKKIPDDAVVNRYVKKIESDPHMTPEKYDKFVDKWHGKTYKSIIKKLGFKNPKNPYVTTSGERLGSVQFTEELEQIMNSSSAWHIAKRGAYDSEQVLERWHELYESVQQAYQNDIDLFGWVIQQITNERMSLNAIINAVDDEIKLMLAGKKSRRLHR